MKISTLMFILFLINPAYAAEVFLFQGFDSPDRYQKLPAPVDKPVLMVYVPRGCPSCWGEWRAFYAAFSRWEKTMDAWFIADFPLWSEGRNLFRDRRFPAKVSNQAYHDPGRRFGKSLSVNEKRPTLILRRGDRYLIRDVAREKDWPAKVAELVGARE